MGIKEHMSKALNANEDVYLLGTTLWDQLFGLGDVKQCCRLL